MKALAFALIVGVPVLLFLGATYDILSSREWAFGMLAWFATLLLASIVGKLTAKKIPASNVAPAVALNDDSRRRIVRAVRARKIWIGVLAVCLPIGIADGLAHRFYWQLPIAIAINLLLMYVATKDIKRLNKRLLGDPNSSQTVNRVRRPANG